MRKHAIRAKACLHPASSALAHCGFQRRFVTQKSNPLEKFGTPEGRVFTRACADDKQDRHYLRRGRASHPSGDNLDQESISSAPDVFATPLTLNFVAREPPGSRHGDESSALKPRPETE